MTRFSRVAVAGLAIVALAAGGYTGWPRPAQADAPVGADLGTTPTEPATAVPTAVVGPVVLSSPTFFVVGHRLDVELPVRTAARRDLLRVEATFLDGGGTVVDVVTVAARIVGGDWRTVAFTLDVPEGATSVTLTWRGVVGPVEVGAPTVTGVASSAAGAPGDG